MRHSFWFTIILASAAPFSACGGDGAEGTDTAGRAGTGGYAGYSSGTGGGAGGTLAIGGSGGSSFAGSPPAGAGGSAGGSVGECGDPATGGVFIAEDVTEHTTWRCPVYTLTKPIFVLSSNDVRTKLTIAAGTEIRGVRGDLAAGALPGALIVTRSGIIEAIGTEERPIVFSSAKPAGSRAPGDWGGVLLLGRAPTNVPANLDDAGNVAGEMYIDGLPRDTRSLYGAPIVEDGGSGAGGGSGGDAGGSGADAGAGGLAGAGAGGASVAELMFENTGDPNFSCGTLRYVRIEFPGFELAAGLELNGLTLGGCGRGTSIEYVHVHQCSDDGIELFGGRADLKHVVITGVKDDAIDWDHGYQGRMQYVAIQMHDDTSSVAGTGDSGIEADGYAAPEAPFGEPSHARVFNLTLIASPTTARGVRLREGTGATIRNAIIAAAPGGASQGLIDLGDAATADAIGLEQLSVQNTIFAGPWPSSGQTDSANRLYVEADYFVTGPGAIGNHELDDLAMLLPDATNVAQPGWVPARGSLAAENAVAPFEAAGDANFFEEEAVYRGAFEPDGPDWARGWAAYPER